MQDEIAHLRGGGGGVANTETVKWRRWTIRAVAHAAALTVVLATGRRRGAATLVVTVALTDVGVCVKPTQFFTRGDPIK